MEYSSDELEMMTFSEGYARSTSASTKENDMAKFMPGLKEVIIQMIELRKTLDRFKAELEVAKSHYGNQESLLREILSEQAKN